MNAEPIQLYFDLISPYSYLAFSLIQARADLDPAWFELRPVVLGSLFSALGVKGPGEIPHRRRHGLEDVLLLAQHYGLPLAGPPKHPFNSLYALRAVCAVSEPARRFELALELFRAAWGRGEDLEDLAVLRRCYGALGLDLDPEEVASRRETRQALKDNTKELLGCGGFGVPSFRRGEQLLFGHDRLDLLLALRSGSVRRDSARLESLLARPGGPRPAAADR